jgi:hypothetical protein
MASRAASTPPSVVVGGREKSGFRERERERERERVREREKERKRERVRE